MNVCCGTMHMMEETPEFENIIMKVTEGTLKFDNDSGTFKYVDTTAMKAKKEEF